MNEQEILDKTKEKGKIRAIDLEPNHRTYNYYRCVTLLKRLEQKKKLKSWKAGISVYYELVDE